MSYGNRNVCKAFKDCRGVCIGCVGVTDTAMSIQHFAKEDDCRSFMENHCMMGGAGCKVSKSLASASEKCE